MIKIPYGESNFERLMANDAYYVDRSAYIESLEGVSAQFLFFFRPRRFGKSLFLSMLEQYYGVRYKEKFLANFGKTYIGQSPTTEASLYFILKYDFSGIDTDDMKEMHNGFLAELKTGAQKMLDGHHDHFNADDVAAIERCTFPGEVMRVLGRIVRQKGQGRRIYLLIDEYDHFTNRLLAYDVEQFKRVVSKEGFYRSFFETVKTATQERVIERLFVTGVSPVTLDNLTSGFNIGMNLTLDPRFHDMMGFHEHEVASILREVDVPEEQHLAVLADVRKWYNGYKFEASTSHRLYNPDMVFYFAQAYQAFRRPPEQMLDVNIASDYGRLRRLFSLGDQVGNVALLEELIERRPVGAPLTIQFSTEKDWTPSDFISLLFYNGLVTIEAPLLGGYSFRTPNEVIHELYFKFFRSVVAERANLSEHQMDMWPALTRLAKHNEPRPFLEMVEKVLKGLDNRDYRQFGEKHLKSIAAALFFPLNTYHIRSEFPVGQGYVDLLLLHRPPIAVDLQFAFELKYVKKSEHRKVAGELAAGKVQLRSYLGHPDLQTAVGGKIPLKSWVAVFCGGDLAALEEIV